MILNIERDTYVVAYSESKNRIYNVLATYIDTDSVMFSSFSKVETGKWFWQRKLFKNLPEDCIAIGEL